MIEILLLDFSYYYLKLKQLYTPYPCPQEN